MGQNLQQKIKISILVVCRNICDAKAAYAATNIGSDRFEFEILLAEGDNPSMQRNELSRLAEGEYLLFLDDDSIPDQNIFSAFSKAMDRFPGASVIGGPSILRTEKSIFSELSVLFFSSLAGLGPFRSRYISQGDIRVSSERELILCNLLMKKEQLVKNNGFLRNFYPNEENELLKRMKRRDPSVQMIYQPEAVVYRKTRGSFRQFLKQLFSYGQGRSKHMNLLKDPKDIIFLLPTMLVAYTVLLIPTLVDFDLKYIPAFFYAGIVLGSSLVSPVKPSIPVLFLSPFFFFTGHFMYGLGFAWGLFKYLLVKRFFYRERRFSKLNVTVLKKFTN